MLAACCITVRGRTPWRVQREDPAAAKRWLLDEYEEALAVQSQVAREMNDPTRDRGYPRVKVGRGEGHDGVCAVFGASEFEGQYAASWRRVRFQMNSEGSVAWVWAATRVTRRLRRRGLRTSEASLRACMEGGWRTQWKPWVKKRASTHAVEKQVLSGINLQRRRWEKRGERPLRSPAIWRV